MVVDELYILPNLGNSRSTYSLAAFRPSLFFYCLCSSVVDNRVNSTCMCMPLNHYLSSEVSSFETWQYKTNGMICIPFLTSSLALHLGDFLALFVLQVMII